MIQRNPGAITSQLLRAVRASSENPFDHFYAPALTLIGGGYSVLQILRGDLLLAGISTFSAALMLLLMLLPALQKTLLRQTFNRRHAAYIAYFWIFSLLWASVLRALLDIPPLGKDSELFYIFLVLLVVFTYRAALLLFALTRRGYAIFISNLSLWEQILVVVNEFIAAGLFAYISGRLLAVFVQPNIFTLQIDPFYTGGLLLLAFVYYFVMQLMWFRRWNDWLGRNVVWVRLARFFTPLALVIMTTMISRHFAILSDARSANLLGTANLNQAILALSPLVWMMIFFVFLLVYTGRRGLRQRFLPDLLLDHLPPRLKEFLETISDMDILLLCGVMMSSIPLHLFLFDDEAVGVIDLLRQQIEQQNALIDSSEQALALLFALPFYLLALTFMGLYAYVIANPDLPAKARDELVSKLPLGMLIIFIIVLYLCAVPFSQVLSEGRLPQLPQELGRVLAFDVLIPLVLLYLHYFLLVRLPYGRGQSRWREQEVRRLDRELERNQLNIKMLESDILRIDHTWASIRGVEQRLDLLYKLTELNGKRDQMNMDRLKVLSEKQELTEISDAPLSLTIARLPLRIVSLGIPLLIVFKVYEWAILNDGLREIANNPNIGLIEFFQIVLQQLEF